MSTTKKIFPYGYKTTPENASRILLLSDGFKKEDRASFREACHVFIDWLLRTTPFNLLRVAPAEIQIYAHFKAAKVSGVPTEKKEDGEEQTLYNFYYDPEKQALKADAKKVKEALDEIKLQSSDGEAFKLPELIKKEKSLEKSIRKDLVIILLPAMENGGYEMEHIPTDDKSHPFVASTLDGWWQQVILRALAKAYGLGDEFVLEPVGSDNEPSADKGQEIDEKYPNLAYLPGTELSKLGKDKNFKWYGIGPPEKLKVYPYEETKMLDASQGALAPDTIALWEGAGRFRKKIYRSAAECLMRRRIGDAKLPLRHAPLPFCKACEHHLNQAFYLPPHSKSSADE